LSAARLLSSCLDRIDQCEPRIQAWAWLDREHAIDQARRVDRRLAGGGEIRKLSGIPVGVKDVFNTEVFPTQMGSPARAMYKAGNDARAVGALRLEGAVIPGKTVTAEFAVHSPGPTRNPHNIDHTPGTSSSGSAAAVASGMVPLALGTQTAGSTIRPASFCGIYGMKPSFGLIPRTGMLKTTDTLDHVGMFARSVDDLALLLDVLRVHGPDYPIVDARLRDASSRKSPWRVAIVKGPFWERTEDYARQALGAFATKLSAAGMCVEEADLPGVFADANRVHADIYDSCLAYYFKDECRLKPDLISRRFMELVERGREITPARYQSALERQIELARALEGWFAGYDIVITLASNGEAPKGDEPREHADTCLIWTLCGVPALTVPVFAGPRQLPFGVQVVSKKYNDLTLLRFAKRLEETGLIKPAPVVPEAS
jgi:Asp-tRNA(Asn)/Glu-tRNA(Gln) amidotransferase A subunit family amidase